jgi:ubiquinone/menaquinone biosynthesis C-methylase UbiE
MQTLDLARLTGGTITAVDFHQPFLDELKRRAAEAGLADRIRTVNADMAALEFEPASFDLVWCEGAAYVMGFENALAAWRPLLARPGRLAATEVAWTSTERPAEIERFWETEYPAIQDVEANLEAVRRAGYRPLGHFELPDSAWWDHYYRPLAAKLPALRERYAGEPAAQEVIVGHQREMDLFSRYSRCYGYVFFVMEAED